MDVAIVRCGSDSDIPTSVRYAAWKLIFLLHVDTKRKYMQHFVRRPCSAIYALIFRILTTPKKV